MIISCVEVHIQPCNRTNPFTKKVEKKIIQMKMQYAYIYIQFH